MYKIHARKFHLLLSCNCMAEEKPNHNIGVHPVRNLARIIAP
jgi:hypothetical protein